jgi:hypothetical protein
MTVKLYNASGDLLEVSGLPGYVADVKARKGDDWAASACTYACLWATLYEVANPKSPGAPLGRTLKLRLFGHRFDLLSVPPGDLTYPPGPPPTEPFRVRAVETYP